ncbi:MAG: hypothetical protein ACO4AU_14310 [bacterium]
MNSRNLFPIVSLVLLITTLVFAFLYFTHPEPSPTQISVPVTRTTSTSSTSSSQPPPPPPQNLGEAQQRLLELENEKRETTLLLERLSAELKLTQESKTILDQLLLGRRVLRDFEKRFVSQPFFQQQGGFLQYFRAQTQRYLSQQEIVIDGGKLEAQELKAFKQDLATWVITLSDEEIRGVARYTAFFFAESLYAIPMNLLASRLVPDLASMDFNAEIQVQGKGKIATRNTYGELDENGRVELKRYNPAQQFFFRRGPKVTDRVILFLQSYLSYSDF